MPALRRLLLTTLLLSLASSAPALAVPDGGIELVDRPTGFGALPFDGVSNAQLRPHALSADGCTVVFASGNDVLSPLDDDTDPDVFVVNRCAPGRPVTLVSATQAGVAADGASYDASVSADGTRVAFTTEARNLLPPGTGVHSAVVVKDLRDGSVTLASRGHGADGAAGLSYNGVISSDGTAVAFDAYGKLDAVNADGADGGYDVYVRFLAGRQTVMATAKNGAPTGGAMTFDVSQDGRKVAVVTHAALAPGDADEDFDAVLTDVSPTGTVAHRLVSAGTRAFNAAVSGDGSLVAFTNDRVWIAACTGDPCGAPVRVDEGAALNDTPYALGFPRGPAKPDFVFWSTNRSVRADDTNGASDLYAGLVPPAHGLSMPFGAPATGSSWGVVTNDLAVAVAASGSPDLPGTDDMQLQILAKSDGEAALLSQPFGLPPRRNEIGDTAVGRGAVSDGGRFVAMTTGSPALGAFAPAPGARRVRQVIVRDVAGGVTTPVSVGPDGRPADADGEAPRIDGSGRRVVFASQATNLAAGVANGDRHVYVRDLATGTTQLVDRAPGGAPASGGADRPDISEDGSKVAFISSSPDLPATNGGTRAHAYVADLATGTITLADATVAGTPGDGDAYEVALDADGSRAAFRSVATNLGGSGKGAKAYRKDFADGALTYVSVPEAGTPDQRARAVSIDGEGDRISWSEDAPAFGYGSDGRPHIYVRDVAAGRTVLASTGGAAVVPGAGEIDGELDRAGTRLVFLRGESDDGGRRAAFLRDLERGETHALPVGSRSGAFAAGLSPDGRCAVLNGRAADAIAEPLSPDYDHAFLRAVGGACAPRPDGGGGDDGGAGVTADTTAPAISGLRMTRSRFAAGRRRTPRAARVRTGTAFVFALSEAGRTSIAIERLLPGRRSGKRCIPHDEGRGRRCVRRVAMVTLARANTRAGRNRVAFTGRVGPRTFPPGRYRATVGATDAAGNRAVPRRVRFRIVERGE